MSFGRLGKVVFLSSPEAVREVFRAPSEVLSGAEVNRPLLPLVGERSLLLADGEEHLRQRRTVAPFFAEGSRGWPERIQRAVEREMAAWPRRRPFPAQRAMQRISLNLLATALLGEGDAEEERFKELLDGLIETARASLVFVKLRHGGRGKASRGGRVLWRAQALDELLRQRLAQRRESSAPADDLLSHLAAQAGDDGGQLAEEEIRDQAMSFAISAHVTTPTSMAWVLHHLLGSPDALARARGEIEPLGDELAAEELARLPYLGAVCMEALRLCPTIPVTARAVRRPFELGEWRFSPGVYLAPCMYLLHQRPELYPEPERFRPERFLERRFGAHEFLPFGGGERFCPGSHLGLMTMKVAVGTILGRLDLERGPGRVEAVHGRSGVTLVPSRGAPVVVVGERGRPEALAAE